MIYIILGVGVVVVVAVTMMNRGDKKTTDPALSAAQRVRDHVHLSDDGDKHGSFERSFAQEEKISELKNESQEEISNEEKIRAHSVADLVWSGRGNRLEIAGVELPGAMTYWSNGPAQIKEPCCIDITLPVKFDENGLPEISGSYENMSPEQRGAYLRWLSRGRMGAISPSYFRTWFFGVERRAMVDKKDAPMCLGELTSRLPSLLENPSLPIILKFMTCLAVTTKYPPERFALDLRHIASIPAETLNVLLTPYAENDAKLSPIVAYALMRSAFPGDEPVLHNDEQLTLFSNVYYERMEKGLDIKRPKAMAFIAYFPTNPSISASKPLSSVETPDFFKDPSQFSPLLSIWEQVRIMRLKKPTKPPRKRRKLPDENIVVSEDGKIEAPETEEIPKSLDKEMRAEIDSYIEEKQGEGKENLIIPLLELSELIELDLGERPTGAQRRGLCEITRTGGRLLIPDLGVSGKIYQWEDLVALYWIEIGERVSNAYRATAILFEFAVSLIENFSGKNKKMSELIERLTLHIKLTEEEIKRFEILTKIFETQKLNPESLAVSFQNWLHEDDKILLRDFLFRLCTSSDSSAREREEISAKLAKLLEVEGAPQPIANFSPSEIGEKLTQALTRLFRSEELQQKEKNKGAKKDKDEE